MEGLFLTIDKWKTAICCLSFLVKAMDLRTTNFQFEVIVGDDAERLAGDTNNLYPKGLMRSYPDGFCISTQFGEVAQKISDFEVRPDDVWLVTFPKCGTTWTQEMVWLIKNELDFETAKAVPLVQRFPYLEISALSTKISELFCSSKNEVSLEKSINLVNCLPSPRFIKSHLPAKFLPKQLWIVKPKIIYVARELKDVMVSYYHHNRLTIGYKADLETFCTSFMKNEIQYCPYWPHSMEFWRLREEPNVLFLTYEEMQQDLAAVIRRTAQFFDKEFTDEEVSKLRKHLSFNEMSKNAAVNYEGFVNILKKKRIACDQDCRFMRDGKCKSWKNEMSDNFAAKIDEWSKVEAGDMDLYMKISNNNLDDKE